MTTIPVLTNQAITAEGASGASAPSSCRLCGEPSDQHVTTVSVNRYQLIRVLQGQEIVPKEWFRECVSAEELDDFPF